jgi:hypothetical protein
MRQEHHAKLLFHCSSCKQSHRVPVHRRGKKICCPNTHELVLVPMDSKVANKLAVSEKSDSHAVGRAPPLPVICGAFRHGHTPSSVFVSLI